jgi:hypothetical protein
MSGRPLGRPLTHTIRQETTIMLTRRTTLVGAVALVVTAALPSALLADGLTTEERRLMANVPSHASADDRAFILAMLRDPDPLVRKAARQIAEMPREQLRRALLYMEALEQDLAD